MTVSRIIDPFELHPESEPAEKKPKDSLIIQQVCNSIKDKMIQIRTEAAPRWGYDKNTVIAILAGLIIELEEKCQHN